MKKVICVLVGLLAFSVGLWFFLWRSLAIPVSLCEVSANPKIYQSGEIHTKAFLVEGGYYDAPSSIQVFDYKDNCLVGANLEISKGFESNETLAKLRGELTEFRKSPEYSLKDGWAIVEIEFIGEIEDRRTGKAAHSPEFNLKPRQIKQLALIRFITRNEVLALERFLN